MPELSVIRPLAGVVVLAFGAATLYDGGTRARRDRRGHAQQRRGIPRLVATASLIAGAALFSLPEGVTTGAFIATAIAMAWMSLIALLAPLSPWRPPRRHVLVTLATATGVLMTALLVESAGG